MRFYLKYIEPLKENIRRDLYVNAPLGRIIDLETIIGYQFECIVLNNLKTVFRLLKIDDATILSASPYFQRKTLRHEACQIDLLIQTTAALYVCEIKCTKHIDTTIFQEVRDKLKKLKPSHDYSIRTVLIYEGTLSERVIVERYFDAIISFGELLKEQ